MRKTGLHHGVSTAGGLALQKTAAASRGITSCWRPCAILTTTIMSACVPGQAFTSIPNSSLCSSSIRPLLWSKYAFPLCCTPHAYHRQDVLRFPKLAQRVRRRFSFDFFLPGFSSRGNASRCIFGVPSPSGLSRSNNTSMRASLSPLRRILDAIEPLIILQECVHHIGGIVVKRADCGCTRL